MKTSIVTLVLAWTLNTVNLLAQPSAPSPLVPPATTLTPAPANALGPRIQFESVIHDFGRIVSGSAVRHDFVFTNTGDATLEISHVSASCGCTTAGDWSRKVEPGSTGTIPIQFNSGHFNGTIMKTVTVTCNDPKQASLLLQIRGTIWKPVEMSPETAVINANSETALGMKVSVRIINHEPTPLDLELAGPVPPPFTGELRTNQPGKDYELLVGVRPPAPTGNAQGIISLKTSLTNMPLLNVNSLLLLQPTVTTVPPQINLPPAPLPSSQTLTISVINNGTNILSLSDPQVNASNVGIEVKETAPGRHYTVLLTFPAGFELPLGKTTAFSVKSSHPQFPDIRVPIFQIPRRAGIPPTSPPAPTAPPPQPATVLSTPKSLPASPPAKPVNVRPLTAPPAPPPLPTS